MKTAIAIIAAALLSLPPGGWALAEDSVPFYVFDGMTYSVLFILPVNYFVAVEENGEEFCRVSYLDLDGYVRADDVIPVDYEPLVKFPQSGSATLKKSVSSVWLYSDQALTNVVLEVTAADDIFLYGASERENVYYVRAGSGSGARRGYISGEAVDVEFPPPGDPSPAEENKDPETDGEQTADRAEESSQLPVAVRIILIVSVTVPAFLLAVLLSRKR